MSSGATVTLYHVCREGLAGGGATDHVMAGREAPMCTVTIIYNNENNSILRLYGHIVLMMVGCLCRCLVALRILREWHRLQTCSNGGTTTSN